MPRLSLTLRLWIWFSLRQLRAHLWRTLAVVIGIGLGAAVFTSVRLAIDASVDSFTRSMDSIAGRADWSVVRPGGMVPEHLIPKLLHCPAVKTASPILTAYVKPLEKTAPPFLLIGLDPILDRSFRSQQTNQTTSDGSASAWFDLMSEPFAMVVGEKLAKRLQVQEGSTLILEHVRQAQSFHIVGRLSPEGVALVEGGEIALTDISSFQEFTGAIGFVDRIDILLAPKASTDQLEAIRSLLSPGLVLERPNESKESGALMIRSYQLNLSVLSFVSLFVGMFLVYSLVSLHATSRRHELSILRSIGASPRLLFSLFLSEGLFFGVIGWLVAMPISSFLVRHLLTLVSSTISHLFVRVQVSRLVLDPWEIVLSFLITLIISGLAASQPALQAMRVPPREALLMQETSPARRRQVKHLAFVGIIAILFVWPLSTLPGTQGIPLSGYVATFLLFAGFSLLSPWCLQKMGQTVPPFLRRLAGEPAYLGGRYVGDSGTRTAISVGALITAMALFAALVIMIHSFRKTVELWVSQSISGDIFLRPKMADLNHYRYPLPNEAINALRTLETPVDLMPYRRIFLTYGKNLYQFEAIDFEVFTRHARFLFLEGDSPTLFSQLLRGEGVLVSEVFANQTGLTVGKLFGAQIENAQVNLPVLGVFRDYRTQGGSVYYSLHHFQELTGDTSWGGVRIFLRDATPDREKASILLRDEILRALDKNQRGVEITTGGELHRAILRIFDETFAITTVLLVIALIVATLGITTTLTVLVLERARELHTLRAIGASSLQIRTMIFWEAMLMVIAGEGIGLGCGFILSSLLIFVINRQSFGWTFIYSVDWPYLFLSLPLILATALLAALPASRSVLKRSPAQILREK